MMIVALAGMRDFAAVEILVARMMSINTPRFLGMRTRTLVDKDSTAALGIERFRGSTFKDDLHGHNHPRHEDQVCF